MFTVESIMATNHTVVTLADNFYYLSPIAATVINNNTLVINREMKHVYVPLHDSWQLIGFSYTFQYDLL